MEISDVIIVGGGAAGLFCAFTAARRGKKVLVLESGDKPGRKILVSGGGRCNFTNKSVSSANYLSSNPHFCKSALARFTPDQFLSLVKKHSIPFHEKKLGQLFCDRSARDILAMLLEECAASGARVMNGATVTDVERVDGIFRVTASHGEFFSKSLVVASGGLTLPKMSSDAGYRIAKRFGILVTELRPALVPLTWDAEKHARYAEISGVSLNVEAKIGKTSFRENLLFTHRGLSGPAVLQISSYWKEGGAVRLNLMPGRDAGEWLAAAKKSEERKSLRNFLSHAFPARFVDIFLSEYPAERPVTQIAEKELRRLGDNLNAWQVLPAGTEGYAKAEVTLGGVDTGELSSRTMESKKVPGLYFIGEVVDVTGWLGGYNFQWAWASAHAAGMSI